MDGYDVADDAGEGGSTPLSSKIEIVDVVA